MSPERLALLADTRGALRRINAAPLPALGGWLAVSGAFAAALLVAVALVGTAVAPDPTAPLVPRLHGEHATAGVFGRNLLVLALHALACVAAFIAGRSVPLQAALRTGAARRLHELATPATLGFVALATAFSLVTQALVLGRGAADLAGALGVSPGLLMATVLPHATLELVAVFLPLGACVLAARRSAWQDLLAATAVTVAIALPLLLVAALLEVHLWPRLLVGLGG